MEHPSRPRPVDLEQRERGIAAFQRLTASGGLDAATELSAAYLHIALEDPAACERTAWSLSVMPTSARASGAQRLVTLTIGSAEVFALSRVSVPGEWAPLLSGFVLLDSRVLQAHGGLPDSELRVPVQAAPKGLRDHERLIFLGVEGFVELLESPAAHQAIQAATGVLAAKGTCSQARSHNQPLADAVLASVAALREATLSHA